MKTTLSWAHACSFAVLLLGATGCTKSRADKFGPLPEPQTRQFRECQSDQDCEYVNNGCCDCMNGGEDLAINKTQVGRFRAELDCKQPLGCTEMGGVCGDGTVRCEQGLCTYHPAP